MDPQDSKNHLIMQSIFSATAEDFTLSPYELGNEEHKILTDIMFSDNNSCHSDNERLCKEISKLFEADKVIFNASEEHFQESEIENYRQQIKGVLKLNNNDYPATLYYNVGMTVESREFFTAVVVIKMPSLITASKDNDLVIQVKGKK